MEKIAHLYKINFFTLEEKINNFLYFVGYEKELINALQNSRFIVGYNHKGQKIGVKNDNIYSFTYEIFEDITKLSDVLFNCFEQEILEGMRQGKNFPLETFLKEIDKELQK